MRNGKIASMEDLGTDGTQGSLSKWWPFLALACVVLILATGNDIFRYFSGEGTPTPVENPHAYAINSPTRVKASDGDSITVSVRLVGFATAESLRQHADCDAELELGKKAKARLGQEGERQQDNYFECWVHPSSPF